MRLLHLVFAVFLAALALTLARSPAGRVGVIVFAFGLGAIVAGTAAVMLLFQTVGALGEAEGLSEHLRAVAASGLVLLVAGVVMNVLLWLAVGLVGGAV